MSTQEVPGCYKEGVLGRRREKIEGDRVGSQFHEPARTLSAQFTCLSEPGLGNNYNPLRAGTILVILTVVFSMPAAAAKSLQSCPTL